MKAQTILIRWHDLNAILSLSYSNGILATSSADTNIRLWKLVHGQSPEYLATLSAHTKGVNVVRFHRNGQMTLASGGDDGLIYIFNFKEEVTEGKETQFGSDVEDKQIWSVAKVLRGHLADVYDLDWSNDCKRIVSGSIDNKVIVWDIEKCCPLYVIEEHEKFVQGVSWDPLGRFFTSMSTDKTCRIYNLDVKGPFQSTYSKHALIRRMAVFRGEGKDKVRLNFIDDSYPVYFRRLRWSTDGQLLGLPSVRVNTDTQSSFGVVIVERNNFSKPIKVCGGFEQPTVAVSFHPERYPFRRQGSGEGFRYIFAVASSDVIAIYDTEQAHPISVVNSLHYAQITDLCWCGLNMLAICSTDGFCSFIEFEDSDLMI